MKPFADIEAETFDVGSPLMTGAIKSLLDLL